MKYKQLKVGDKSYTNNKQIDKILGDNKFHWIIDSEIEDAEIELKNNTVIWENGKWLHGTWEYGIWLNGVFYGKWSNGIFEKGTFKGEWKSGIDYSQNDKN